MLKYIWVLFVCTLVGAPFIGISGESLISLSATKADVLQVTKGDSGALTLKVEHVTSKKPMVAFYNDTHLFIIGKKSLVYKNILSVANLGQSIRLTLKSGSSSQKEDAGKGLMKDAFNSIIVDRKINFKPEIRLINKDISKLKNKISINKSYGNNVAVKRDETLIQYYQVLSRMFSYIETVRNHVNNNVELDIPEYTKINKGWLDGVEESTLSIKPLKATGIVSSSLNKNIHDLYSSVYVFKEMLDFVEMNPDYIREITLIDIFSLTSWINLINDNVVSENINSKINRISLDVGGIIMFIIMFLMVIVVYPLLFSMTNRCINKYILKVDETSDSNYISDTKQFAYTELRKPIKILMVFFGLDLSTQALLYKTELVGTIDQLSFIVYVIILSWIFLKIINALVSLEVSRIKDKDSGMRKELFNLIIHIIKGVTIVVSTIIMLTHFGISIAAILSTLGIGGLAFALAAKDTLSNLFGGVSIMIDDVFSLDDWVKIGDAEGTVASIGLRSTTIRTFDNALITIPNAQISTSDVMNWNKRKVGRRIKMWIGVTYESDMADIKKSVEDIRVMLKEHKKISNPIEKFNSKKRATHFYNIANIEGVKNTQLVFVDKFNAYSIDILIYCFSKTVKWEEWLTVKEDVLYKIAAILKSNNVEFAYPTEVRIERSEDTLNLIDS